MSWGPGSSVVLGSGLLRTSQDFSLCRIISGISSPMMSFLIISRRISSLLSSHHNVLAQFISCHVYLIISHLFSSLLISSHPSIASHSISSHHIISYHLKHHLPSFSSTPLGLKFPILSLYGSMPLFSPMNIKHPSIRE